MKPYDIYNLWVIFDKATNDPAFSTDAKAAIARDMLGALPHEMMCSGSEPSLAVVREAMEGRLNELNSRSAGKTGVRTGTSSLAGSSGNDHLSNEGDGVSLEGVVSVEEPAKQPRKGRKAGGK